MIDEMKQKAGLSSLTTSTMLNEFIKGGEERLRKGEGRRDKPPETHLKSFWLQHLGNESHLKVELTSQKLHNRQTSTKSSTALSLSLSLSLSLKF